MSEDEKWFRELITTAQLNPERYNILTNIDKQDYTIIIIQDKQEHIDYYRNCGYWERMNEK